MVSQSKRSKNWFLKLVLAFVFCAGCLSLPYLLISPNDAHDNFLGEGTLNDGGGILDSLNDSADENKRFLDSSATPILAECGVYVKSFGNFDFNKNSFFINFYIWWILEDSTYSPDKTMEITNAQEYKRLWAARDKVQNKMRIQARYLGTINQDWDMKYFPFDRQKIRVSLEDNIGDINKIRFTPIPNGSKISPDIKLRGWRMIKFDLNQEAYKYSTNFGNLEQPDMITSRLNIIFELKRDGWAIFFVYFIGYIVALILCILTYFTPQRYFGETITLCLGAIFAGIGNKYQLDMSISHVAGISLSGVATICTFLVILLTIINVVVKHILYINGRKNLSYKLNYSVLFIWILVYGAIMEKTIGLAVQS